MTVALASPALAVPAGPHRVDGPTSETIVLPSIRRTLTHAASYLVLGTVAPLTVFYLLFSAAGLDIALAGVLVWSTLLIGHRVRGARRIEATLLLSTALMLVRVGVTFATGSAFLYLLQPLLSTFVTAVALVGSVAIRRPFTERVTRDYVPMPADLCRQPTVHRLFSRISMVWGVAYLINGTIALWMLTTMPMGQFLLMSKTLGLVLSGAALALSLGCLIRTLRRHRIRLSFGAA